MSHFVVTVAVPGCIENAEAAIRYAEMSLAPFHQFECTGTNDQYVQNLDALKEHLEEYEILTGDVVPASERQTFVEYLEDYADKPKLMLNEEPDLEGEHKFGWFRVDDDGNVVEVIKRTNPNDHWDWYVVGGRWAGFFTPKPGATGLIGRPGVMGSQKDPEGADVLRKKDIDYEEDRRRAKAEAGAAYDKVLAIVGRYMGTFQTFAELQERHKDKDIDFVRKEYHAQPAMKELAEYRKNNPNDNDVYWFSVEKLRMTREEYIAQQRLPDVPFAFVDKDGNWNEKGSMG